MRIAEREQQILGVKAASFQPELDEALEQALTGYALRGFLLWSGLILKEWQ
jgi:hypothetical protein